MPDFVAALVATATFCASLILLNGLTRMAMQLPIAPTDLAENGLLQYGAALALAWATWRRAVRRPELRVPSVHGAVRTNQNRAGIVKV